MIRRLSLSQRLALVVVSLLMLCAVAVCAVQLHSSAQYGNAMVQRLSSGLAQQIVAREPLLDAHGEVNRQTLKSLFDRLMTFNPSVELYLLSPDGDLLADAAPPGHIQRQRIDMAPVQAFLTGSASPVYGDDPRSPTDEKSSAPPRCASTANCAATCISFCRGRRLISWRPTPGKKRCGALFCGRCCWWPCLACWQGAGMVLGHPAGPPAHRPGGGERSGQHQRHQNPGGPQAGAPAW